MASKRELSLDFQDRLGLAGLLKLQINKHTHASYTMVAIDCIHCRTDWYFYQSSRLKMINQRVIQCLL